MRFLAGVGYCFALLLGVGCLRELRCGRRPVWLAPWLAAAIVMLTLALARSAAGLYGVDMRARIHILAMDVFGTLLVGLLPVFACPASLRLKITSVTLVIMGITGILAGFWMERTGGGIAYLYGYLPPVPYIVGGAVKLVLILLAAFKVFTQSPEGSVSQATVFLFSLFALGFAHVMTTTHIQVLWAIIGAFLSGFTVLTFARASRWRLKRLVLSLGVLILVLFRFGTTALGFIGRPDLVIGMVFNGSLALIALEFWVVIVPVIYERFTKPRIVM